MLVKKYDEDYFHVVEDRRSEYDFPIAEQVNSDGDRYYLTPEKKRYPSISSVASFGKEASLLEWRARVGEQEANRVSRIASRRGTKVHELCELYLLDDRAKLKTTLRSSMPDVLANWSGMRLELKNNLTEIRAIERPMYTDELRLAGTTDCIGMYKGRLSVIDFKTSAKFKERGYIDGYFKQADGYGVMWKERTGETPEQCVIIIACDETKEPQVFTEPFGASLDSLKQTRLAYYKQFRR